MDKLSAERRKELEDAVMQLCANLCSMTVRDFEEGIENTEAHENAPGFFTLHTPRSIEAGEKDVYGDAGSVYYRMDFGIHMDPIDCHGDEHINVRQRDCFPSPAIFYWDQGDNYMYDDDLYIYFDLGRFIDCLVSEISDEIVDYPGEDFVFENAEIEKTISCEEMTEMVSKLIETKDINVFLKTCGLTELPEQMSKDITEIASPMQADRWYDSRLITESTVSVWEKAVKAYEKAVA